MGKATFINQHDWMAVRASFPDGVQANVTWNRGGSNVSVTPHDRRLAEALSLIVDQAGARSKDAASEYRNLGEIAARMEAVAKQASSLDAYVAGLRTALGVTGERPAIKGAESAPAQTVSSIKPSRGGWLIEAAFPNGEKLQLKVSRASIGLLSSPQIASRDNEISKFVFGLKQIGTMDDETLARALEAATHGAPGIDEWLDAARSATLAGPKPR